MARVSDEEIRRLKQEISLERLAAARGVKLKRHGKDLIGLCPFHDDREPSLVLTPDKNLWHCLGACQAGGTVIDWVMKAEGVSFRHAVELLRTDLPLSRRAAESEEASPTVDGTEACDAARTQCKRRRAAAAGGGFLPRDTAGEPGGAFVFGQTRPAERGSDRALFVSATRTARWATVCRTRTALWAQSFVDGWKRWGCTAKAATSI